MLEVFDEGIGTSRDRESRDPPRAARPMRIEREFPTPMPASFYESAKLAAG